jgi:hypothetical protein
VALRELLLLLEVAFSRQQQAPTETRPLLQALGRSCLKVKMMH